MSDPVTWIDAGKVSDLPALGAQRLRIGALKIGLFKAEGDQVFAIEDRCPHKQGPLTQGIVHGNCVTCPLHNWVISLSTGEAQGADEGSVSTFAVKVDAAGLVTIAIPDAAFQEVAA